MTPQESKLIEDLASRIAQTQVGQKDAEAENLIRQEIGSRPDALYILVQTVLVQTMALEQAKAQIADLQQKLASAQTNPPAASTSFLGGLFGSHAARPPAAPQPPPAQGGWQTAPQPPAPGGWQTAPPAYAPAPGAAPAGGGASSFLRSAATTAAGVAAGALAFEGIESLIHGFGHQGGVGGMGGGSGFLQQPGGETIVNNYYDSPRDQVDEADRTDDLADTDVDDPGQNDADDQDTSGDGGDDTDTGDDSDSGGGDDSLV
jgi:uncharacterized protein